MEFGHMPPMFGMGIVDSMSEVIRLQQQAAEQTLAQMQLQAQREAMKPPQPAEQALNPPSPAQIREGQDDSQIQTTTGQRG